MKKIRILSIFVLLCIGGFLLYRSQRVEVTQPRSQETKPTTQTGTIPNDWQTLSNMNHTLKYPPEATADARRDETVIVFMGQKQIDSGRTQTELFDGYSFRIGEIINDSMLPLKTLAEKERENAQSNCLDQEGGQVSALKQIVVDGEAGFQYSAVGCYIDYTESIVGFEDKFYRISQSYVGDAEDQENYQKITNQIYSTLQFAQ